MSPRASLALLVACVLVAHLWLANQVQADHWGLGAGAVAAMPQRLQVAFVRELAPAAPPQVRQATAPAPRALRPRAEAVAPAGPASAPAVDGSGPDQEPPRVAAVADADLPDAAPAPTAQAPASAPVLSAVETEAVASAAAVAVPPAASSNGVSVPSEAVAVAAPQAAQAAPLEWPPSTRLSYTLSGNYRGPVEGQAQVEWLLQGARYQVHMDLSIGPRFAPLASRRVSSEGRITLQGLAPQRYDEETRALFRQSRRLTVRLDEERVRLANGNERERPPGVQDSASQFVHLTWLFTTQPDLLQAGRSITLPLALPNHLEPWTYDVLGAESLQTPAGEVQTFHVKPRRAARAGVDLTAEIWVAPRLQYLPVRILIRQDADTYLDLLIERLPQQAAPPR